MGKLITAVHIESERNMPEGYTQSLLEALQKHIGKELDDELAAQIKAFLDQYDSASRFNSTVSVKKSYALVNNMISFSTAKFIFETT